MSGQMAAVGGNNAVHAVSPNTESAPNTLKRGRSRSEVPRAASPGLMDLMTSHGGPPVAGLYHSPSQGASMEHVPVSVAPGPDNAGADDDEDMDGYDDKGLVMEFPPVSRLPVPTFEGFKAQIEQVNPRLEPALIHRFAHEQVRRYKKLVELQQKHSTAVANGRCKTGKFCFALGGEAKLLEQRKTSASSEAGQTQFRIADFNAGPDQPYAMAEGAIAAAQFPPGVPIPPVAHLPAEFECSICFSVKKFQKPSDWTKHVHEDAQPFTCSFPECSEPKSFKRKADWVRHENELHRHLEWWTCSFSECNHTCYRKNNFLQHLVREHKMPDPMVKKGKSAAGDGLSDSQRQQEVARVWQLIEECRHETSDTPHREPCRFCGNICASWRKLTVHLGKHMEQLTMPVLQLARQSCASPPPAHPVGGMGVSQATQAAPFPRHQDATAHLGRGQYVPSTNPNPLPNQNYAYDMPVSGYPSIAGGELSMEPESMTEPFQPSDQYAGYSMGQFGPATLHPPGQTHPLHQNSVTYPPPRPRTPDAHAAMLPNSYSMSSHLLPQESTLYPVEAGYPAYQPGVTTSPYTSGPYTSSYSSQM
ncbi:Zinc finger C2H2 [Penicillium capsulatum]|uniref:Zinc finger C2H2 n=1 Tax=Penicillium capsulatum TaxID=69766 RepID=A0A9W9ILM5_9EURO|nr:Zinc finger C2H2 [Penicillium capsulatum]